MTGLRVLLVGSWQGSNVIKYIYLYSHDSTTFQRDILNLLLQYIYLTAYAT